MDVRGTVYNDSLVGSAEDDVLLGLAGDDILVGGLGGDRLDGGPGRDTASYRGSAVGVTIDLSLSGPQSGGEATGDQFISIEQVYGSLHDDRLTGDAGANFLWSEAGRDTLIGGAGNDTMGTDGIGDRLDGGEGTDTLQYNMYGIKDPVLVDLKSGTFVVGSNAPSTVTGFERLQLQTGDGNDTVIGGDGDSDGSPWLPTGDSIYTGFGNDYIEAGGGNDSIHAGYGADTVYGGSGNDTIYADQGDLIDAGSGDDLVYSEDGATLDGGDGYDRLQVSLWWSDILFDFASGASSTGMSFRNFEALNLRTSSGNDTLIGGDGNDTLDGGYGNDIIRGGAGDDSLESGYGNDSVDGGAGNDTIDSGYGDDTVLGGDGDDQVYSGYGNDFLDGGAGNDALDTGFGNDTIVAGQGADTINGGPDTDWLQVVYDGADDFRFDFASGTASNGMRFQYVEILSLHSGSGNDSLVGSAARDTIDGGDGNDTILGGDGDDLLSGGSGNDRLNGGFGRDSLSGGDGDDVLEGSYGSDTLVGGAGNDQLWGGANGDRLDGGDGRDTAVYLSSLAGVTVDLRSAGPQSGGDAEGDVLTGIENVTGSRFADRLTGDDADNTLRGGAGADTLDGGAGLHDRATYAHSSAAVFVDLSWDGAQIGGDAAGDVLIGIEDLTGSSYDDALTGDDGDNIIQGGAGADRIDGGDGRDTADYAGSQAVRIDLTAAVQHGGDAEGDRLTGIENVQGSSYGDWIVGDTGDNLLSGLDGDDTLAGGGGDDLLRGGAGDDVLEGGDGNDELAGHTGNDVLTGGDGADIFVFRGTRSGQDRITDFDLREGDGLRFSHGPFRDASDVMAALSQTEEGALIQWMEGGATQSILLAGVDAGDLDAGRFLFG